MSEIRSIKWKHTNELIDVDSDWKIKLYCLEQDDVKDFDLRKELEYVESCHEKLMEVFSNPNKYERRLAKMENIPIDEPATKSLHSSVVFTSNKEDYCMGSGGVGGGKTFWTPYTIEDEEIRNKLIKDDICDNCRTVAHELQHGIGGNAEFDKFSELIGIYFRLENFDAGERLEHEIEDITRNTLSGLTKGWESWKRKYRNMFCAMNERYPDTFRKIVESNDRVSEIMKREGYDYDRLVKEACK